jgi:hypothetical protein
MEKEQRIVDLERELKEVHEVVVGVLDRQPTKGST